MGRITEGPWLDTWEGLERNLTFNPRPDIRIKHFPPEPGWESLEGTAHFSNVTLWILVSSMTAMVAVPMRLPAQATSTGVTPPQAAVYGTGPQTPLRFAGESAPENEASLGIGFSTLYDDNVLGRNSDRLSDEVFTFYSHLGVERLTEHVTMSFDYLPFFTLYRQLDQYDQLNHNAKLAAAYQLTPWLNLGVHDTFSYQYGIFPSLLGQQLASGPTSPTALNQTIFPYTARNLSNMAGLDLTFIKSRRTSLTLSGGYNQVRFGSEIEGQPLYNGNGLSAGLQVGYRVSEHTNVGILLLHQDTTYQGGKIFGNRWRSQIESTYLSMGSRLYPTVTAIGFGGVQYVRSIGQASAGAAIAGSFHGAGGGSITKEVGNTAVDVSGQRSVSDGGGIYTSVVYSTATIRVRRRLVGRWEVNWQGGATRADASLFQSTSRRTDGVIGDFGLDRPLSRGSVFHISYETSHQSSKGNLLISAPFDRNRVTVGIDYQLKAISLGR